MNRNPACYMKNVTLFYFYQVFSQAAFQRGIFVLFLLERNVSALEVGILQTVLYWSKFVAEIPTGMLGDKYGRRLSILAGLLISAFVATGHIFSYGFSAFLILFMLQGIAFACVSGSDQALLYDSLKISGKEGEYLSIQARMRAIGSITLGSSIALGGILKEFSWTAVYFSVAGVLLMGVITVFFMLEAPVSAAGEKQQEKGDAIAHNMGIVQALKFFLGKREGKAVVLLLIASGLLHATITPYFIFSQRMFDWYRIDVKLIALIFAVVEIGSGIIGLLAKRAARLLSFERMFYVVFALVATLLSMNWIESRALAPVLFFLIVIGPEILIIITDAYYQDRIPSSLRASLLSSISFVESLFIGVAYFVFGFFLDHFQPNHAIALMALIPLLGLFFSVWYFRATKTEKSSTNILRTCSSHDSCAK